MEAQALVKEASNAFAPPPDLTISEWSNLHRVVSIGPFTGKWRTDRTPDLQEPMDCAIDPNVEAIVIVKPTRIGGTDGPINNVIGYHIHHDPCDILYAQSSKDQGELYSDSILMPMLRDTPVLNDRLVHEQGRKATQTKTKKEFVGGAKLRIIGAKSPKGFQAIQARLAIGDDLDEWEVSKYGDPVQKLIDRTKGIWNRKIILVSFPTHEETSRIWSYYLKTDMRQRWVPCPLCDEFQVLKFGGKDKDYGLKWDEADIWYECEHCHGRIPEYHKDAMNLKGEWRAENDFNGWAGFKLNPFLRSWHRWTEIKDVFLSCGKDWYKLMVFTTQMLGDVWVESSGEKIDEDMLYARREIYSADVPAGVKILTAAVDTQDNRLECTVYGWGIGEESWVIEHRIFMGSPVDQKLWNSLDTYLLKSFLHESGDMMEISGVSVDAGGHYSSQVYTFTQPREGRGFMAVIGSNDMKADILDGDKIVNKATGAKRQRVGVSTCKKILMDRLRIKMAGHGYMHFPKTLDMEFFIQLLGEREVALASGKRVWRPVIGRRNEVLDLHNYNLATLRMLRPDWESIEFGMNIDKGRRLYKAHQLGKHLDFNIELSQDYPIIVCCDFKKNPLVWELAQTDERRVWVFDEIHIRNADTTQMVIEVMKKYGSHKRGLIAFGSAQGNIVSSAGKSDYAILADYKLPYSRPGRTNPPDIDRINAVGNMLENIAGEVRLTYGPRCTMLRRDFERCLWQEDMSDLDRTEFGRGNASDALGHFIVTKWPMKARRPNPKRRCYK